jgi:hypothetical protein
MARFWWRAGANVAQDDGAKAVAAGAKASETLECALGLPLLNANGCSRSGAEDRSF